VALTHIEFDGIEGLHLCYSRVSAMWAIDQRYIPYSRVRPNIAMKECLTPPNGLK
jgi:hypothetical protein